MNKELMRRIEHLPESVHSSVRSGIILHDLTRVVEELIFNSLDAGATKVYVAVGIGTNFVKVVDNGYGVDRDGLVLLGERYATSRHSDFHALESRGNFGFHGEALSSIADVSLIEITTKAPGMPHGYRKVMKGCKCLHLGINDDNREVGTTVIVRDLFYNQPVRRKRMQSSPKKVLHSIKKCVLRIALVHSTVSFRVADIESELDLLRTGSSLSPLQLLANNFGVEANKHLQEIEVDGNDLRLSGYISCPLGIYSMKALQYIYINSRFVCKGPIHKLLNQLANGYVNDRKHGDAQPQLEKRSRSTICPTFILDLSCPKSYYEITFEPTKNLVEFKDWGHVLQFIQKAVTRFWIESTFNDLLPHDEVTKKRRKTQKTKEWDNLTLSPENLLSYNTSELEKLKSKALVIHDTNNLGRSCSSDVFHFEATENELTNSNLQLSDHFSCDEDSIWKKDPCFTDITYFKTGSSLEPICQEDPFAILNNCHEFSDIARIHGHQQRSSQFDFVPRHGPFSTIDDLGVVTEKRFHFTGRDKSMEEDDDVHDIFRQNSPSEDKAKKSWLFSKCTTLRDVGMNFKCLSPEAEHFDEDIRAFDPKSEWGPPGSSTSIDTTFEDVFGSSFGYVKGVNFTDIQSTHVYTMGPPVQDEFFFDDLFCAEIDSNNGSFSSTCSKVCVDSFPEISDPFYLPLSVQSNKNKGKRIGARKRARRFSAPPFYKHRKKYSVLGSFLKEMSTEKTHSPATNMDSSLKGFIESKNEPMVGETGNSRNRQALNSQGPLFSTQTYVEDSFCSAKKSEAPEIEITETQKGGSSILDLSKGLGPKTCENTLDSSRKWRNNHPEIKCGVTLSSTEVEDPILDIGSGILNLSGDLLVPNCISRSNLEEAHVLRQVDNKYIPVVAGRTLAIIDQHAADERIRLEELRNKVLSGETRESTYLEAEQELVVPEIGYQLLQNYAEEIEKWGWICRIDGEGSPSFSKNLNTLSRRQTTAKLVGVPCILGVNLTDVDLLEFLQQLADTDGSSTIPPSVHRVLNNKACRGAIMFGDSLLPSECSLIVEELARTSLCFQCAHGRPTTVPLVDLTILHHQINTMRCNSDNRDAWHGLRKQEINPRRAAYRLNRDFDIKH